MLIVKDRENLCQFLRLRDIYYPPIPRCLRLGSSLGVAALAAYVFFSANTTYNSDKEKRFSDII